MKSTTLLSDRCRGELSKILGPDQAIKFAHTFDSLLPHYDHDPRPVAKAKTQAITHLTKFLACVDDNPEILSEWPAFRDSARAMLNQLTHPPFEIIASDVSTGEWRRVNPPLKSKIKAGRPGEERRAIVGGLVAYVLRLTNISPTRGRRGTFAKVYTAVCKDLRLWTPREWDQTTLDDCIQRGARNWEDTRLRSVRARADAQMDEALREITIKGPRKRVGKK